MFVKHYAAPPSPNGVSFGHNVKSSKVTRSRSSTTHQRKLSVRSHVSIPVCEKRPFTPMGVIWGLHGQGQMVMEVDEHVDEHERMFQGMCRKICRVQVTVRQTDTHIQTNKHTHTARQIDTPKLTISPRSFDSGGIQHTIMSCFPHLLKSP